MAWIPAVISGLSLAKQMQPQAPAAPQAPGGTPATSASPGGTGSALGALLAGISGGNTQAGGPGAVTIPAQAFAKPGTVKKQGVIKAEPGKPPVAIDSDGKPGVPIVAKPGEMVVPVHGAADGLMPGAAAGVAPNAGDPTAPQALPPPAAMVPPAQGTPAITAPPTAAAAPPPANPEGTKSGLKWQDALQVLAQVAEMQAKRMPHPAPGVNLSGIGRGIQSTAPFASNAPPQFMPQQGAGLGALLAGRA